MPHLSRWRPILAVLLLVPSAWLHAATPLAPTPEQIQALQQLPPEQRELLRRALSVGETSTPVERDDADPPVEDAPRLAAPEPRPSMRPIDRSVRLRAGDTLLIELKPMPRPVDEAGADADPGAESPQRRAVQEQQRRARLPSERLFTLDQFGALTLPNIGRLVLAGLNEFEAAERIGADPTFRDMQVRVKRLPVDPELKRFGHDLFTDTPKTFAPATDIPIPADYVVGPGDLIVVQMYGKQNSEYQLTVTRDGMLRFPGLGPLAVAGKRFSQLQKEIGERVQRQFIGARADVTLGRLRSIRVFVMGDVIRPGSYTVSSLSTLTNALFVSGGVTAVGSLRDIQLKRNGELVKRLDLYELLLSGDTRNDVRLLPGDVIFVPPSGPVVGVGGRVRRPALYELREEQTLGDVIRMAGGLLADAYPRSVRIERVGAGQGRSVVTVDLSQADTGRRPVQDGDVVRVYEVADRLEQSVALAGWVVQPGPYQWTAGMRLRDLIPSLSLLRANADSRYVLIRRENPNDRFVQLIGANLGKAIADPEGSANLPLQPGDEVHVYGLHEDRANLIQPMLDQARAVSSPAHPAREVGVEGAVHHPGSYPWSPAMTVDDLLDAAGGLTERAYTLEAELTRFMVVEGKAREQARQIIALRGAGANPSAGMTLEPYDRLVVRHIPQWEDQGAVDISGEVRFPGRYPIARGERLSRLIQRAGGLTEAAYPRGAVFLRESVREREQQYLERLTAQLERDLGLIKTEGPELGVTKEAAVMEGETLLRQMRATKAVGRMVIRLDAVMDARAEYDVVMQPGDKLIIPQRPEEVTVVGEVYYPTSHLYVAGQSRDDYVRLSGGTTERGNRRAIYVVHADGSVSPPGGWFNRDVRTEPGDTVIVPLKVDRISNMKLFTDISTILYQLAVTAAALDVIGVF